MCSKIPHIKRYCFIENKTNNEAVLSDYFQKIFYYTYLKFQIKANLIKNVRRQNFMRVEPKVSKPLLKCSDLYSEFKWWSKRHTDIIISW